MHTITNIPPVAICKDETQSALVVKDNRRLVIAIFPDGDFGLSIIGENSERMAARMEGHVAMVFADMIKIALKNTAPGGEFRYESPADPRRSVRDGLIFAVKTAPNGDKTIIFSEIDEEVQLSREKAEALANLLLSPAPRRCA